MAKVVDYVIKPWETMFGGGSGCADRRPYPKKPSTPTEIEPEEIPEHLKPYDMKGQPMDLNNLPFDPAVEAVKEGARFLWLANQKAQPKK